MTAADHPATAAVAATRVEAQLAGERALREGGNAVDAAIAAGFALAVVEPYMTGPGAVGELVHVSPEGTCTVVEAGAIAPLAARPDMFETLRAGPARSPVEYNWPVVRDRRNEIGFLAATAPRLVQGLFALHRQAGLRTWESLVRPAVELAQSERELDFFTAALLAAEMDTLIADPLARVLYYPNGVPLRPPVTSRTSIAPNPALAATLAAIADEGAKALTEGPIADAVVASARAGGGILSPEDLEVPPRVLTGVEPLVSFRGWSIFGSPYPSGATTAAHILRLLDQHPPATAALSEKRFVATARAISEAVRFRLAELSGHDDPRRVRGVLSGQAATTTHVSVADATGGVAALTLTLLKTFGCQRSVAGCGFFLNNGMWWFDPVPGRSQSVVPGGRALSAVAPLVAVSPGGERRIAIGGLGARPIFASVAQALESAIDYGLDVASAVDLPRVHADGEHLFADRRLPQAVRDRLACDVGPVELVPYTPISLTNARLTAVDTLPPPGAARVGVDARARATDAFGEEIT